MAKAGSAAEALARALKAKEAGDRPITMAEAIQRLGLKPEDVLGGDDVEVE
ncbi:MAG TPA: hypothetical protein VGL40_10290 [Bacillota bacterium]